MMINNVILENCKAKKKNIWTVWIDYNKVFNSVLVVDIQMPLDI